jgi:hypothetical protein
MAVQALSTPVTQKHRTVSMHPAHIYYYTYLMGNFSQLARKMFLMGSSKLAGRGRAGRGRGQASPLHVRNCSSEGDEDERWLTFVV